MEHLNPRAARIVALEKPTDHERTQWYFQRYVKHLPSGGEIVFFDRSWYNRAGVERVMGFCSAAEYLEFMRQAPELELELELERMLVRSGLRLHKYWFSVTREEQARRFKARETDPLKHWKLSPIDKASLDKWDDYTEAKEAMFFYTDRLDMDNNVAERCIRPLVLSRKNALFASGDDGGERWACIASLVETCKLNGVDPQRYFTDVLTRLVNGWMENRLDELMPWHWAASKNS